MRPLVPQEIRTENTFHTPLKIKFVLLYNKDNSNGALHRFVDCCKESFYLPNVPNIE